MKRETHKVTVRKVKKLPSAVPQLKMCGDGYDKYRKQYNASMRNAYYKINYEERSTTMTEMQMVEDLRKLASELANDLEQIDSKGFGAASKAYDKIDAFNKNVESIKYMTVYFNKANASNG